VVTISCVGPSVVIAYSGPSIIITNNSASFADPALNNSHTISPYADFVGIRRGGDVDRISDRRKIQVAEVRLLSSKNYTLRSGTKIGGAKAV
jgi:hypothetical protein